MTSTTYLFESAGATHKGMRREHNEDSYLVDPDLGLYVVCDGMGGHQAGDVASRLAVDAIQKRLAETLANAKQDAESLGNTVLDALNHANQTIRRSPLFDRQQANMGTTVALVLTRGDSAIVAHVGDSRVYRLRGGKMIALTRDHSFLQAQVGAGFVSKEEARLSHNRNLVTRALGMEATVSADVGNSRVAPGDVYLICSDGLNTMVSDNDILEDLGSTNGTILNGEVIKRHILQDHDVVEIGAYRLEYLNQRAQKEMDFDRTMMAGQDMLSAALVGSYAQRQDAPRVNTTRDTVVTCQEAALLGMEGAQAGWHIALDKIVTPLARANGVTPAAILKRPDGYMVMRVAKQGVVRVNGEIIGEAWKMLENDDVIELGKDRYSFYLK